MIFDVVKQTVRYAGALDVARRPSVFKCSIISLSHNVPRSVYDDRGRLHGDVFEAELEDGKHLNRSEVLRTWRCPNR